MSVTHLVDTSALARIVDKPAVRERWSDHLEQGVVAICDITELEFHYSARSLADRLQMQDQIKALFNWIPTPDAVFSRAHRIQRLLTEKGLHRSGGAVDLVLAATAELSGLTLLHYDRDFETIATVCDLTTAWLAEPGSV
jgi:predicted nucleic acid-binding protein